MKFIYLFTCLTIAALLPKTGQAELEPLLFSGQPGIMFDTNNDGNVDGMVTAMYDADTNVIVAQASEALGGDVVIFQIDLSFGTQVLNEIAQFPLEGQPQFVNSRSPDSFLTLFLDTVDFTPLGGSASKLLEKLLGGAK